MKLTERIVGDAVVVDVEGRPSVSRGSGMVSVVEDLLKGKVRAIVLNLRVRGFDSSCMGEALVCHLKAKRRGAALCVVSDDIKIWDVIKAMQLDRVLDCHHTEEGALAALRN